MPLILLRYRAFLPVSSSEPERRRGYDGQERNATDPSEVDRKHDFIGNTGNRQHKRQHDRKVCKIKLSSSGSFPAHPIFYWLLGLLAIILKFPETHLH